MNHQRNRIRIIGGQWRRRNIPLVADDDVRPSTDRIRETLFNWLAPYLPGARCLDLFAGSGILGIEAASRGASWVTFVERNPTVLQHLERACAALPLIAAEFQLADALAWLGQGARPAEGGSEAYDVVFLDPPFGEDKILAHAVGLLDENKWLAPGAQIYLERRFTRQPIELPPNWSLDREKKAGRVGYYLASRVD